ncbi:cellulase family glycosylhydrolase [Jiulongibacter sediminis]|uniref:cellulase family glycosylhydrolase n=1 Tax=Jiulongibacter sediminis TaxID=1605367 RepID=UPI0026ECB75E|nr:cellulase family glycosylhydrolase [Jiulongibacter sediminis]
MFEAPSENAWGNPFRDDYFQRIAELGFSHVRLPITWETDGRVSYQSPYTINPSFLNRIKYVIDKAYEADLMIIINMHHHEDVFEDPEGVKDRFLSQWSQIGDFFKDYNERLLFEVLNEPHGNLSPEKWNSYFAEALEVIRETNPDRAVLIGVAQYGGLGALPQLKIPNDPNLILTIHYYEPFQFTHQGAEWVSNSDPWLGTVWENTDLEQRAVESQFQYALEFSQQHQIPVNIGEFGAYSKADMESRVLWTNFLARWFEKQGFSWAYWEFSSGFGFFDPNTNTYLQSLVDALLLNEFPEPVITSTVDIYTSDFTLGNDGWSLSVTSPAVAGIVYENNEAKISIDSPSDQGWHIQFQKGNISLKKGRRYLVSFDGKADQNLGLTSYVGMSVSPWASYSGYAAASLSKNERHFEFTFLMNEADDSQARFVFDMGNVAGTVYLYNLKIEEIVEERSEEVLSSFKSEDISIYPNPGNEFLRVKGGVVDVEIFDYSGKLVKKGGLSGQLINIENLPAGLYLISLQKADGAKSFKRFVKH